MNKDEKKKAEKIKKIKYKLIQDVSVGGELKKKGSYIELADGTAKFFKQKKYI